MILNATIFLWKRLIATSVAKCVSIRFGKNTLKADSAIVKIAAMRERLEMKIKLKKKKDLPTVLRFRLDENYEMKITISVFMPRMSAVYYN